jgi:ATP-binding cassette subfamily G (WHITE) protein 2 (PDR)
MATRPSPGTIVDEEKAQSEGLACDDAKQSNEPGNRLASPSSGDSTLDPDSPGFNARHWMKSWIAKHDLEQHPRRVGGFAFCDLNVYGFSTDTNHQKTVWTVMSEVFSPLRKALGKSDSKPIHILRNLEGFVESGEMLVVLGPPGSGCSTFLKTIAGMNDGAKVDKSTRLNYRGISAEEMHSRYRGETIYTAEVDVHFPHMTVKDTLDFAARARAPRELPDGLTTAQWADQMCRAYMAAFGIAHTADTRVGGDVVRGVSGGERKRVTIAEATLSGAPVQCWDNSTRGLDSSNAIEFCKTIHLSTELGGAAAAIALYQAPQAAYDTFNKALVLYQGRQIFFGRTTEVTPYFEALGFVKPERQTDADFATSMTSPQERIVRNGYRMAKQS